jgi:diaminopimelate epimerase
MRSPSRGRSGRSADGRTFLRHGRFSNAVLQLRRRRSRNVRQRCSVLRSIRKPAFGGRDELRFETLAGVIRAEFHNKGVKLYLSEPKEMLLDRALEIEKRKIPVHSINTGVPHVVTFVDDLEATPVRDWGAKIRYHTAFYPKGTNANFVKQLEPGRIAIRTYERGVEDETLACGTGVTASGLIYALLNDSEPPIRVLVRGGDWLEVGFRKTLSGFEEVTLEGPGDFVFEGTIDISGYTLSNV